MEKIRAKNSTTLPNFHKPKWLLVQSSRDFKILGGYANYKRRICFGFNVRSSFYSFRIFSIKGLKHLQIFLIYFLHEKKIALPLHLQKRELSSAGSEHLPYKQRVGGSNPSAPTSKLRYLPEFFFAPYCCRCSC